MSFKKKIKAVESKLSAPAAPGLLSQWKGLKVGFIEITPKLAEAWLKHNVKNRKLKDDSGNLYARDIKNGNWLVTHQGVAFNDRHELIDGQHRFEAVIRAGKPAVMMVTFVKFGNSCVACISGMKAALIIRRCNYGIF